MNNFRRLACHFDMWGPKRRIAAHPELWDANPERTSTIGSPHAQSSDIWLRYRDRSELHEPADFRAPHWSVWYPAWEILTALRPVVFGIAREIEATHIGGILMSRIAPGKSILPHVDAGWHAETMTRKVYAIIQANPACVNFCGSEAVVMREGECWEFRNDIIHSVTNDGPTDRIALIMTCRTT